MIARLFKTLQTQKIGSDLLTSRIHAHLLRRTFATMYLENGGNIYALQQILGHTSLEMVKKYVHLTQAKTVVNFKNYSTLDNLK
ncbi:MAG: tyrosine-type recombinase/integrase [Clostridia bacterium]|nr:tyrosine-type recombinase/integrase [Clostridia bacterium]